MSTHPYVFLCFQPHNITINLSFKNSVYFIQMVVEQINFDFTCRDGCYSHSVNELSDTNKFLFYILIEPEMTNYVRCSVFIILML